MDPLSISASVIACIQIADRVISVCKDYVSTVKNAPSDLRTMAIEVGSIKCVLEVLELLISPGDSSGHSDILQQLEISSSPLQGCKKALADLEKLFPAREESTENGKRRKVVASLAKLAWPLKENKARKYLADIGQFKATISLALAAETTQDIKNMKVNVEYIRDALSDERREAILKWLVKTDPSPNHNRACSLHEEHTGRWFVNSPEYEDWTNGTSHLWLYGIPGAGKTVLISFIIENVKEFCKNGAPEGGACIYYYCYFGRRQDETPDLLRWVINQLCRQSQYIPDEILGLYRDGSEPAVKDLIVAFTALLSYFTHVYLLVDALDESSDRQNLLDTLTDIALSNPQKLRILAMSRKEADIQSSLQGVFKDISLSNPRVDEDIRVYIHGQLHNNRKFSLWPKELKVEVEAALVDGARGMFRWVFCQIDILGKLKTESAIRDALKQLPKTLDETYERILAGIPPETITFAYRALLWLSFTFPDITLDDLASAVTIDIERCSLDPDLYLLSPKDLQEICSCLMTVSDDDNVQLAHYTVKEYLSSDRIKHGSAANFYISESAANFLMAKSCIIYLLNVDHQKIKESESVWATAEYPFFYFAAREWTYVISSADSVPEICKLLIELLDPCTSHLGFLWEYLTEIYKEVWETCIPMWIVPPGAGLTAVLSYAIIFDFDNLAKAILTQNLDSSILGKVLEFDVKYMDSRGLEEFPGNLQGTPLHIAAALGKISFVELLIKHGADVNFATSYKTTVLCSALTLVPREPWTHAHIPDDVINLLIKERVDLNPLYVAETPLQMAVRDFSDSAIIKTMLIAGAKVNTVGDDEAVKVKVRTEHQVLGMEDIDKIVDERGLKHYYDTPLKIVMKKIEDGDSELIDLKDLLESYGGKALHLFPVRNLPGYVEADMKALCMDCKDGIEPPLQVSGAGK